MVNKNSLKLKARLYLETLYLAGVMGVIVMGLWSFIY